MKTAVYYPRPIEDLIQLIEAMAKHSDRAPMTVSHWAGMHSHLYLRLKAGQSCRIDTYDTCTQWLSGNWPADLAWPADIPRPGAPVTTLAAPGTPPPGTYSRLSSALPVPGTCAGETPPPVSPAPFRTPQGIEALDAAFCLGERTGFQVDCARPRRRDRQNCLLSAADLARRMADGDRVRRARCLAFLGDLIGVLCLFFLLFAGLFIGDILQ